MSAKKRKKRLREVDALLVDAIVASPHADPVKIIEAQGFQVFDPAEVRATFTAADAAAIAKTEAAIESLKAKGLLSEEGDHDGDPDRVRAFKLHLS